MTRAEKVAKAQALRAEGLKLREIAERMGAKRPQLVSEWLNDPDGSRCRARHERARRTCVDCGNPTAWAGSCASDVPRCKPCADEFKALWTRETVIAAIRRFAGRYGRAPHAADFNPAHAASQGHDWRVRRFYADADYPRATSVVKVFGTWNAAIKASGFEPTGVGRYQRSSNYSERGAHLAEERAA